MKPIILNFLRETTDFIEEIDGRYTLIDGDPQPFYYCS